MQMAEGLDCMTLLAYLEETKRNSYLNYHQNVPVYSLWKQPNSTKIWNDFHDLHQIITNKNPSSPVYITCFNETKAWVDLFTSLQDRILGYRTADVTPYMHALVYHVPLTRKSTSQSNHSLVKGWKKYWHGEKCSSQVQQVRSCCWCITIGISTMACNLVHEQECSKRTYSKANSSYWETEISEKKEKKKMIN